MPLSIPRQRETISPEVTGYHRSYKDGAATGYNIESVTAFQSKSMSDFVTPGYQRLVRNGEIINNACTMVVTEQQVIGSGTYYGVRASDSAIYEVRGNGSLTNWLAWASGFNPALLQAPDVVSLRRESQAKALAQVDSSPYQMLEDVGELAETIRFLKRPFTSFVRLGKRFRRDVKLKRKLNGRDVRSYSEASASVWLEYRFAIMPLVRSMLTLWEAAGTDIHRPKRRTARGIVGDLSSPASGSYLQYWSPTWIRFMIDDKVETTMKSGILYTVDNPVESLSFKYGLRLADIPETAWNLLPLSFMVDRVVDISTSIRGITNLANPSIQMLAGFTVEKTTAERTTSAQSIDPNGWGSISLGPDAVYYKSFLYERSVWTPSLMDATPTLHLKKLANSATKLTDLVALGISLFSKR
jgi:hypothetical protein